MKNFNFIFFITFMLGVTSCTENHQIEKSGIEYLRTHEDGNFGTD